MTDANPALIVLIPHNLGKAEANRRIRSGLERVKDSFAGKLSVIDEAWTEDRLEFRVAILGQAASGAIDIAEDNVRLAVQLPRLLMMLASKARALVERQGRIMLEKK
ncbi:MAG: polyhydroxyalkanoic acid system family protein [Hyphomicrobiales bacterium]|nr:polyhydroxyalkanoic acid system family protein [Hyphomicrobiales bacterium]